jgi:hypothetical protein
VNTTDASAADFSAAGLYGYFDATGLVLTP